MNPHSHVDAIPAPAGIALSFVESEWHRLSAVLENERAIARLAEMLDREPCWDDLQVLAGVSGVDLDPTGRLMRLMATRRVSSFLDGQTVRDVVDFADGDGAALDAMDERTARHEIGLALGRTKDQAEFLVRTYRRLVEEFPDFVTALTTVASPSDTATPCTRRRWSSPTRPSWPRSPARRCRSRRAHSIARFLACLRRLIQQRHDPDAAARRRQARLARRVAYSNLGDGISSMTVVARTEDVEAMRESIRDAAMSLIAADRARTEQDPAEQPSHEQPRLTTSQARS